MKTTETTMTATTENATTMTTEAIDLTALYADKTAAEVLNILNGTDDRNLHKPIIEIIEKKLQEENKKTVKAGLENFANMAKDNSDQFWTTFINEPFVPARKFTENKDGTYALEPVKRKVNFSQIDKVYGDLNDGKTIAESKNYVRMLDHITNNLYRQTCADLSTEAGEKCAVVRVAANIEGEKTMREVDFSKASKSALKTQIQAFLDTTMPDNVRPLVCSADVNYILKAFETAKDGIVKTAKEKRTETIIWEAVKIRANKRAYTVESQADCHKDPNAKKEVKKSEFTESQEEKTSKIPERPEAVATLSKTENA